MAKVRPSSVPKTLVTGNFGERPEPPKSLTKRQIVIWKAVVASEDPIFFNTEVLRGLLADYCRRRALSEELGEVIEALGPVESLDAERERRFDLLTRSRDREMHAVGSIATRLRLTNQSRYQSTVAGRVVDRGLRAEEPWRKSA